MPAKSATATLVALLLMSMANLSAARAGGDGPVTGLPDESIASSLPPDRVRASLAGTGITYGVNYIGEFFDVTSGGLSNGTSFNGRLEGYADLDLEKLVGWKGGTVHANFYYIHGEGPSTKRIGNIFAVSNVEALETVRLFELWMEQSFLDDKVKIRFGQLAADSEFFISDTAGQFFNGTFGWPGIVAANMTQGGPAYPLATPGVRIQYSPNENLSILAGIFNGSPADPNADDPQRDNRHGTNFRLDDPPLIMVEGQYKYTLGLPGTLRLGGWKGLDDFADQLTGDLIQGNHGLYAVVDQQIWKNGEDQGISVFGRISGSPDDQNLIDFYFDTGIVFSGLVPGRAKDSFGAAFGYGKISDRARAADIDAGLPVIRDYESVIEVNYTAQIIPGWTVVPDFQYIWNPGGRVEDPNGLGQPEADTAVFGVRTNLTY